MPVYFYKVRDESGKVIEGQMDASDGSDLRRKLDEKKYFIIEFSEKRSKAALLLSRLTSSSQKVSMTDLSVFSWQLYTMLDGSVTLISSLRTIHNQTKNETLRTALRAVCQRVEAGTSFSEALREHPHVFSRLYVQMVNAGEVGGVLDEMLKRIAEFYERQAEIQAKLRSALIYPILLLTISTAVVIFLVTYILPKFALVFADMGVPIPAPTELLLKASALLKKAWPVFLGSLAAAFVIFKGYVATPQGRSQFDSFKLNLPVIGELIRKTTAARFTQTLSTLITGGIPILTALDVVIETIHNTVVTRALKEVSVSVGEGKSIAQPLGESGIFPEMVVNMIKAGEETGALDKMLEKVAHFYDREVDQMMQNLTKLVEPLLIVFMTVVIGFIGVSIFAPLADVMRTLHN